MRNKKKCIRAFSLSLLFFFCLDQTAKGEDNDFSRIVDLQLNEVLVLGRQVRHVGHLDQTAMDQFVHNEALRARLLHLF